MQMRRRRTFEGATALVTGGGSGIGLALGRAMAAGGAHVVLADLDVEAAQRAAASAVGDGLDIAVAELDVTDRAGFAGVVEQLVHNRGRLDYLVNSAGISIGGPTQELTGMHWDRTLDVNLGGVINGVLAAYPHMVSAANGHIVNIASGAGLVAPPFVTAYATSKHAVVGLSLGLRPEAALHGVRVGVVCPGAVDTPILDRLPPADLPTTDTAAITPRRYLSALGQNPIAPDAFASAALPRILRDQPIVIVPARDRALWLLHRVSPAATLRVTGFLARKVQRELIRPSRR